MDDVTLLYTTWPDPDTAERAAKAVVEEGLAACANVLGAGVSIYRWKGTVERAPETVMLLKTTGAAARRLCDRIVALHPYETPAVVALPVNAKDSHPAFLDWVARETVGAAKPRSKAATPKTK